MSEFLLNEQPCPVESGQNTWADLRDAVDARAAAQGDVVTVVRFEGVDQPTFSGPCIDGTPLPGLARIEIDTVPAQVGSGVVFDVVQERCAA